MKTKIKKGVMLIAIAVIACLAFGLIACTDPEPSNPVLAGISITNKTELAVDWRVGDADRTMTVSLSPESFTANNTEITVTSSGAAITVDGTDKFKLHAAAEGKATVTVTAGDFSDSVEITVKKAVSPLNGITINETELTAEWYIGEADRTVTVAYDPSSDYNATNTPAVVTSSAPDVVNVEGMTLEAVGAGTATVTVTAGGKTATAAVTVMPVLQSITLGVEAHEYMTGGDADKEVTATVLPSSITGAVITFASDNEDVAVVEKDDASGKYMLKAKANGTAKITATVHTANAKEGIKTAEFEVTVRSALSSITVTNATTFDSDIAYGSEKIELNITLDNDYTLDDAQISVVASDTEYVSVIKENGKWYAVINKITYGTEKSNGVTIEIKSDRFTSVSTVTLTVKVAATAPVIELSSEAEIQAFAGDAVALPTITTSKKCDSVSAPTVTVKKGENVVADAYDASNNTVTCAETGEDYTVTYTLTDDRAASPLTTSKTINVKLYRKVFKAVTGRKVYDYPEAVLDFDYVTGTKFAADSEQKLSIQESNTVLGQFNMTASKYYYAEATFTLKNPSGNSFVGLSHSLPVESGTPTRWLAAMVDRGDRNFKIKDIDMTDQTVSNGSPKCFDYGRGDILYRNKLVGYGGLTDSDASTVKVAVARADEYFYAFVNDQFVMANTDKDYSEPTAPGIFGIKLSDNEAGVTIGSISWVEGSDATNTKLTSLYSDKYYGYHKWDIGPSFDKADNGFTTSNDVGTSEDGVNGCYMLSGITPYIVFDGDFKVEYDYTNTKADYAAVRWTRGALLNVVSALSHTDGGQKQVMAATGLRITGSNATSGNNVVYHGSPAMQESGVPYVDTDVDWTNSGANYASFTDNLYESQKPYSTYAVHNNDKIHFSVERRLKSDRAEYTMQITIASKVIKRVMTVNCDKWSDSVMFMWGNQSCHGSVSNVSWQTLSA